jgi:hypothetical protein
MKKQFFIVTQNSQQAGDVTTQGYMGKHQEWSQGRDSWGKIIARVTLVVSVVRNGKQI